MEENEINFYIKSIDFSKYILPDKTNYIGKKYILNGDQNSFFQYVKDRYLGSTTNSGIIDKLVKYTIGGGLVDLSGDNINKYISKRDLRLIVQDFKMYGQYSIQVIWSQGSKLLKEEPKPIQIKHIPTEKLGLSINSLGQIDGYWYSFDWTNQSRYKPTFYSKFDGIHKENPIEILTVTRISSEPYFPQPDYISGLQYAHLEQELSNSHINYILNDFSVGTIIVAKGGIPPTEELRERYTRELLNATCGTSNKKKPMVYFTNNTESDIEIKRLEVNNLDAQIVYFSEEAKEKLFDAHGIGNRIIFGNDTKTGFSNNADEMNTALDHLFISVIEPMREEIIEGLESVLKFIDPKIQLKFSEVKTKNKLDNNG